MMRYLFLFLLCQSFLSQANVLDGSKSYVVPDDEQWIITSFKKHPCNICTADLYIKNGQVKIENTWLNGVFSFSLNEMNKVIIDSYSKFHFGDSLKSLEIEIIR